MEIFNFCFIAEDDKITSKKLREYIVSKIRSNELKTGDKLPSVRALSSQLNISKSVVENTYFWLRNHFFIKSIDRSGYVVAESLDLKNSLIRDKIKLNCKLNYEDYSYNSIYTYQKLIANIYKKMYEKSCYDDKVDALKNTYNKVQKLVSNYLSEFRGLNVDYNNVIFFCNYQEFLSYIAENIKESNFAIESKHMLELENMLKSLKVNYSYLDLNSKIDDKINVFLFQPYSRFPDGHDMSKVYQEMLLEFTKDKSKFFIETCFNSSIEYKFRNRDKIYKAIKDNYIYVDNFSEFLGGRYRLIFAVLPDSLLPSEVYSSIDYPSLLFYLTFLEEGLCAKYYFLLKKILINQLSLFCEELDKRSIKYKKHSAGYFINIYTNKTKEIIKRASKHNIRCIELEAEKLVSFCFAKIDYDHYKEMMSEIFD